MTSENNDCSTLHTTQPGLLNRSADEDFTTAILLSNSDASMHRPDTPTAYTAVCFKTYFGRQLVNLSQVVKRTNTL